MKILQINKLYSPWLGGVETHVKELSESLVLQKNIEVNVLCCNTSFKTVKEIINKVKVIRCSSIGIFFSMPVSFSFFYYLKKSSADILHFHLPNPLAVFSYLITKPKGRIIVTWHSDIIKQKFFLFFFTPFLNIFLQKTEKIIITSPNIIQSSKFLQKFREKLEIVPLSLVVKNYQLNSKIKNKIKVLRKKYPKFVLFVGRLVSYKGILYLLQAIQNTEVNLIIIGNGPLQKNLELFIKNCLKKNQVTILSKQNFADLLAYYFSCDFFILPSITNAEAFGIVQLEAMICKKPVISTDLPTGVPYVNQNGITGLTVKTKNVADLRKAILKLWNNNNLCNKLGEDAYKRIKNEFTSDKMLNKITGIYKNEKTAN